MATAGSDGLLKLWDTGDLSALPISFTDNGGLVLTIEFSPDGEVIVSGKHCRESPRLLAVPPTLIRLLRTDVFMFRGTLHPTNGLRM